MFEDRRKSFFIGLGIVAGLSVAFLLLYLFVIRDSKTPPESVVAPPPAAVDQPVVSEPADVKIFDAPAGDVQQDFSEQPTEAAIRRFVVQQARIFVERFGTYSSHNANKHIEDVLPLATPAMQAWLETQSQVQSSAYTGATMKVVESSLESFADTRAVVSIGAQQERQGADGVVRMYLRGTVRLVAIGNEWKVDGLFWEDQSL
ncbi:MAG: hypothetical protein COU35_03640 [Candidatus Magasanikbacteria bacterium CG10_big_fil_rev_8_21_14_0_10_47_10]|uniref:Uncharacterized protein n=1 Tax=Candidatus Magasanikbacteria bacterium CG10_big_fil_rev_8_21_14_0_10_47_10 TaxID=1974652 RepID=A0A2H0TPZ2_9BACT|nr:MAG: hypothetical protein COU35_03640 [Candidatus Magasanikbacteria bacterium CG10_big_fil_rev_8_21_14_0_10_47_10]